jgi:DNA-binding MarR family transcriptional regulator
MAGSHTIPHQAQTLGALLRTPYWKLSHNLYGRLAKAGYPEIRPAHSAVFRNISPDGSRTTELAEQADMTKQSMAYLVGYLERHGYVRLEPDPKDGRAKIVRLTPRGRRVTQTLVESSAHLEEQVAMTMGQKSLRQLRRQLVALSEGLDRTADGDQQQ